MAGTIKSSLLSSKALCGTYYPDFEVQLNFNKKHLSCHLSNRCSQSCTSMLVVNILTPGSNQMKINWGQIQGVSRNGRKTHWERCAFNTSLRGSKGQVQGREGREGDQRVQSSFVYFFLLKNINMSFSRNIRCICL